MSFLSKILPAAASAAAVATGNPELVPYIMAASAAATYEQTGSLAKGLAAGASAYGGGELATGLAGLGTSEAGASVDAALQAQQEAAVQQVNQQIAQSSAQANQLAPELTKSQIADIQNQAAQNFTVPADVQAKITAAGQNPFQAGLSAAVQDPSKYVAQMGGLGSLAKTTAMTASPAIMDAFSATPQQQSATAAPTNTDLGIRYKYNPGTATPAPVATPTGKEPTYFPNQGYTRITPEESKNVYGFANGGDVQGNDPSDLQGDPNMMAVKAYDPVVRMKEGGRSTAQDTSPMKKPKGLSEMAGLYDMPGLTDAAGLYAHGGLSAAHHYNLGGYSDGGRLLKGPGDGVSDSIPATIGNKRPARLADGEFVVPARIVSELGNGSTEAGARQLYAMMDRVQKARGKTTGKDKVAKDTRAAKYLPA